MRVLLVGYGKMGKEIEKLLSQRGHTVVGKVTSQTPLTVEMISDADVAIEFSTPQTVLSNIEFLLSHQIPVIVGTTGWNAAYKKVKGWVTQYDGALVHASNFSVGVNLLFKLNEQLAQLMKPYQQYHPHITEIHHTQKLDAPSGTAISLATGLLENYPALTDWYCLQGDKKNKEKANALPITAIRKDDVKGTHLIEYQSTIDTISIQHEAHNREGFALGALISAEWIQQKKGIFTMKDVLQLS